MFGQGLFFEVGTRFSGENDGSQNTLLRLEKTYLFGSGLSFEVGTHFSGGNDGDQNSLIRFKKLVHFFRAKLGGFFRLGHSCQQKI